MSRPNLAVAGFLTPSSAFITAAGNFAQVPPIGMRTAGKPGETSPAFTAPFEEENRMVRRSIRTR